MTLNPDSQAAINWLRNWNPDGPWNLVAIEPKRDKTHKPETAGRTFTAENFDQAIHWIEKYQGRWNLYFSVNIVREYLNKSPNKEDVRFLYALHLDADLEAKVSEDDRTRMLTEIEALEPPPPLIIWSGGGYQAFWRLEEALAANQFQERVESVNKSIELIITGASQCYNSNRLMRLPGTVNVLNFKKIEGGRIPALAEVIKADWETWHNHRFSINNDKPPHWPEDFKPEQAKELQDQTLAALPAQLSRLIITGDASKWNGDRSKLVWHIVCTLLRLNWSEENIEEVITNTAYACSAHVREQAKPNSYAKKQILNAKREIASDWERTIKGNIILDSQRNVRRGLDLLNIKLTHDDFRSRNLITTNNSQSCYLGDAELDDLWISFDTNFGFKPQDRFFKTLIGVIARENSFHPVLDYLSTLHWDGVHRIDSWLHDFGGAPDNEYTRAVGRLILLAAVRRVRHPGCKFDEMLVLVNQTQGTDKSTAVRTLAVREDWFSDSLPLRGKTTEVIEQLSGKWLIESSDLTGMRKASVEHLKSFMSRQVDYARLAWGHFPREAPRQCVFFGTTNDKQFLTDTSNRRFWPVPVNRFNIAAMQAAVDQMWAEAAHFEATGESIRLHPDLWLLAAQYQEEHRQEDSWASALAQYLDPFCGRVTIEDTYKLLDLPPARRNPLDGRRLTDVMKTLGWERATQSVQGRVARCFIKGNDFEERRRSIYVHFDPITRTYDVSYSSAPTMGRDHPYHPDNQQDEDLPF